MMVLGHTHTGPVHGGQNSSRCARGVVQPNREQHTNWTERRGPDTGIEAGRPFLLASPLTSQNLVTAKNTLTIFGQEVMYLYQAGYRVSGNYMVPPR
jgi:hypothetical protein